METNEINAVNAVYNYQPNRETNVERPEKAEQLETNSQKEAYEVELSEAARDQREFIESERILRAIAEMSPSFGLVGSVVGLIGMLVGVGDTSVILATVPIALTSTLYGVVLSNFFFLPFAANIRERTDRELLLQKIITDGLIAIGSDLHPRILETKLKSFLTPSSRTGKLVSYKRIQEKFGLKQGEI